VTRKLLCPIERTQKRLTAADWNRLKGALAASSFWTLDPIEDIKIEG
jgi:hypothetical protein